MLVAGVGDGRADAMNHEGDFCGDEHVLGFMHGVIDLRSVSVGAIGTLIVIQRTGIPRVYVIMLAFRWQAPVIVYARRIERRGCETRT